MLDEIGRAFQCSDLGDTGDITPIPFDAKFEGLVGIETCGVDAELSHGDISLSGGDLAGHLLDLDHDELGGLQGRESDDYVQDAEVDVILRGGLAVALDEVRITRRRALERALAEKPLHEGPD